MAGWGRVEIGTPDDTSPAASRSEQPRAPRKARRRFHKDGRPLTARERLAAAVEDPWGLLVFAALLLMYAVRVGPTPLLIPTLVPAVLVVGLLVRNLLRQARQGRRGALVMLVCVVLVPALLGTWISKRGDYASGAWKADGWFRPRHAMAVELVRERLLEGLSRAELTEELGPPDRAEGGQWIWTYEHSSLRGDHHLMVEFDDAGRVSGVFDRLP